LAVAPSTVKRGDEITVTVSSGEPMGDWLLRICESSGEIRSRPTRLSVYGDPVPDKDSATLECRIRTIGYKPGEYMVDVSPDEEFALGRTKTQRLVVEAAGPGVVSRSGAWHLGSARQAPDAPREPRASPRSGAWYLAPILFGLIGGFIAYVITRHDDPRKAKNCLIIGLAVTVLWILRMILPFPFAIVHPLAMAP